VRRRLRRRRSRHATFKRRLKHDASITLVRVALLSSRASSMCSRVFGAFKISPGILL